MSLLETLQLIGYSLGALLPLWMGYLLFKQRLGLVPIQKLLMFLGLCMVGWHASNLVITLRSLLGLNVAASANVLRIADTVAVISITLCYSMLLHVHLYLWAGAQSRGLTRVEKVRAALSYIPCIFLLVVVSRIWSGSYQPMRAKLSSVLLPFALWATYSLVVIAVTELLVAGRSSSKSERRILQTLAFSFVVIAMMVLAAIGLGLGRGTVPGLYLQTFANLGSLLPSALLAYYIYRYRFLELIIKESLIIATFAAVVLAVYLYGIRRVGDWASARYGLRAGVVEAMLILALTLIAAPLRGWLERSFRKLFERETALYREVVTRIGAHPGKYRSLPDLLTFIEQETSRALSLGRVKVLVGEQQEELEGFELRYPLSREGKDIGAMFVSAPPNALTPDVRAILEVLAGQVAIAVEDFRLANENIQLERKLAEGERLAALGQMAATVAHEVKNPLSAIKSIAQVMSEDEAINAQHARDLNLIVGETDRLSKSVTQLLSFASRRLPAAQACDADELLRSVAGLFRVDAAERNISLRSSVDTNTALDGIQTAAVRDALSNLVLNALQATPAGGEVKLESSREHDSVVFVVADSGSGIPAETRAKIWEPFFTTKQRGTGLGLAIVRKRMEEAGGSASLMPSGNGKGARFELRLPVAAVSEARP